MEYVGYGVVGAVVETGTGSDGTIASSDLRATGGQYIDASLLASATHTSGRRLKAVF